ncbi:MAG: HAD family phosphatase [Armatimonadetes bacterium]|nr:HAD family phosphatase [Armatimonadota bacterium]
MQWALVFDVDGVIADTEALNAKASVEMFRQLYGVAVQPEDFRPFVGTGDERYVEGVAEKYGVTIDTQAAVLRRAECFFALLESEPLPAAPGVPALVKAAREGPEVGLAIATSGQKAKQFPVIEGTGLKLEWFDVVITGDDVTRKKPDPQIYALAAERLGLAPARCVVFEDAPVGVQAARAAGCPCIAVTSTVAGEELAAANIVVKSLADIPFARVEALALARENG